MANSRRRYYLFFLPLVIVFLVSFKYGIRRQSSATVFMFVSPADAKCDFFSEENLSFKKIVEEASEKTSISHNFNKPQVKYWKKYRRWSSVSLGIRQPVRNIEACIFDSNGDSTYIKPFFLSHLHSFLFRLTPF